MAKLATSHESGMAKLATSHESGMAKLATSHESGMAKLATSHESSAAKLASGINSGLAKIAISFAFVGVIYGNIFKNLTLKKFNLIYLFKKALSPLLLVVFKAKLKKSNQKRPREQLQQEDNP
jgi:hypothetical protein